MMRWLVAALILCSPALAQHNHQHGHSDYQNWSSDAASDLPSCSEIQARAKGYSLAQVMAFARKHKLTAERRQHVRECLRDKK